jgi:hypothetical protein
MPKHIGYYLSDKLPIDLEPIDDLTPEAKTHLARALLTLAHIRTGRRVEGIALTQQVAKMTGAQFDEIENMDSYQKIRLASAVLTAACDELSIEYEQVKGVLLPPQEESIDIFLEPA